MINVPVHALTTRCPLLSFDGVPEWGTRVPLSAQEREGDTLYMTQGSDTLPKLAHKFYGDVRLWWVIWDVNLSVLRGHPMYLPLGVTLRIPSKQAVEAELLHDNQ